MKELLFSVNQTDCKWDYYRGSGKGGQKRNKTSNCVRCVHVLSGAVGKSEEGRSQLQNRQNAFRKMAESPKFKIWHRLEVSKRLGTQMEIEAEVERQMKNIVVEGKVDGKWSRIDEG